LRRYSFDGCRIVVADVNFPACEMPHVRCGKGRKPDWSLLGLPEAANLPAVKWRQQNLDRMQDKERAALVAQLKKILGD
jgi:hypothetical protein